MGRNFYQYQEEKPWAAITAAAISSVTVEKPKPDAALVQEKDIVVISSPPPSPNKLSAIGGGSSEGSPIIYHDTSFENEYQTHGFGNDAINLHETTENEFNYDDDENNN